MKLGQRVSFNKYLKNNNFVNLASDETAKENKYLKYHTIELEETKTGIVAGSRTINYRGRTFPGYSDMFDAEPSEFEPLEKKEIILVACHMRGFYRVPEDWLILESDALQ